MRVATALLVLALALTGCETNAQRSARLERKAKLAHHGKLAQTDLTFKRPSRYVKILSTKVLHDENGIAAVVSMVNSSPHPLHEVPIAITLREPSGRTLYQNNLPGLSIPLTHVGLLMAGQRFDWVDDQIPASGTPGRLSVRVGEAPTTGTSEPTIAVTAVHLFNDPTNGVGAEATVVNHSSVAQQELVVFAVGVRAGRIVAAGRAVIPNAPANSSTPFQVFFIGNPKGASLKLSAPPSTLG
jgi:hypothetical protein